MSTMIERWYPGIHIAIAKLIEYIGDNPNREGLKDTPARITNAWLEFFEGYEQDPKEILKTTFDDGKCDEMVIVRDIEFTSFCEHHWLPFEGFAHVGYLPDSCIVGLSKIPRLVDVFAKRLQVQERLTTQIAEAMVEYLKPKGVGVVITAKHMCMSCRGVRKQNAEMVTCALRGAIKDDPQTRAEFLQFIRSS